MVYKIYKSNNYIIIIDENDNYFEEHCATVLVTKNLTPDTTYTITFFRPESVPQAFYNIPFADIRQQSGAPYASVAAWETWYTSNTGLCSNNVVLNSILATLQAQTDVEGVYVKDIGNSDKIVLQVKVWDQDSQTYIATYYYNADGSLYTPVGPLEWVGPSGAVAATIVGPLGTTTDCADAVAVTFCDQLNTEIFDQGSTLDNILTQLQSTLQVDILNLPNEGQQIMDDSISVTIASDQLGIARTPGFIRPSGTSGNVNSVAPIFYSVSVANVGSNPGGVLGQTIKPGEVLNFSADAVNNYFTSFAYDATGTDFIIIYVA